MKTSPDLPTTVDFGNNLVNYIEVSAEMALQQQLELAKPGADGQVRAVTLTAGAASASEQQPKPAPSKYKAIPPRNAYKNEIPQYLVDFDQTEESPAYQNAVSAIEKLPTPPSLPGFLSKPILNAATLMKDDNSVLNMPNHTVLNHLATSSIKNNVLAVCATTRYRGKVCASFQWFYGSLTDFLLVRNDDSIQAHLCGRGLNGPHVRLKS